MGMTEHVMAAGNRNGNENSRYPYPTRISGYLPSNIGSVSDPNLKLHYLGITRIVPNIKISVFVSEKTGICTICIWYPADIPDLFSPLS
jgi:hypothetical protein